MGNEHRQPHIWVTGKEDAGGGGRGEEVREASRREGRHIVSEFIIEGQRGQTKRQE